MLKKDRFALSTLISGFLTHVVISTFQVRSQSVNLYLYSYLSEISYYKFSKTYLDIIFSVSTFINIIFRLIGVLLKGRFNTLFLTGVGLTLNLLSRTSLIIFPDIRVYTISTLLSGAGSGLVFMPILIDVWKYFPNSRGLCTSFIFSGFGITRLIYKYVCLHLLNPDKVGFLPGSTKFPKEINDNFLVFSKQYFIFIAALSTLSVMMIYPYEIYPRLFVEEEKLVKINEKKQMEKNLNTKERLRKVKSSEQLSRFEAEEKKKLEKEICERPNYLKALTNNYFRMKNFDDETIIYEPFLSLIVSFPFLQLTFVFFFSALYGLLELSSLRRFGLFFGHKEEFLAQASFLWKISNLIFFTIWGYLQDKIGVKTLLMFIITIQITVESLCCFIANYKIGFLIFAILSSAIKSANYTIPPTCYALIFGDEKGLLLYSISSLLINSFYICRPLFSNLISTKVYFKMCFLILTVFSMFSLIILCFFIEKKHVYKEEIISYKKESIFRRASELSDIDDTADNEDDNDKSDNDSLFKELVKDNKNNDKNDD